MAVVVGRLDAARGDSEDQIEGAETIFSAPTRCRIRSSFAHWRRCLGTCAALPAMSRSDDIGRRLNRR